MKHYLGTVAYRGTSYSGFQRQSSLRTIQGELERALSTLNDSPSQIKGAGRTDAKVHAKGQTFSFYAHQIKDFDKYINIFNSLLPDDIALLSIKEIDDNFDARHSCSGKKYEYRFCFGKKDPFKSEYEAYLGNRDFDVDAFMEATGTFVGLDGKAVEGVFGDMLTNPGTLTFWAIVAIVISFGACGFGLQKGIEKVTKVMMIALLLLMIALAVNSAFLPNAAAGIKFYLVPDFGEVAKKGFGNAVFAAMSQAFFTLSIGIGSMEIFGSYLDRKKRITGEAANIVLLDTFVALMAGFIIIPVCFAYGVEPGSGPSLLFITLPTLFNNMAGGRIWGTLFFIFMSFAALSTIIAVFEEILAFFMDIGGWSRKKAVSVNFVLITVLSLPAILGFNVLSGIQPLGEGSNIMDMEDFLVSSNLLPLGSLVFVLFCVRKNGWGFENFLKEANKGEGIKFPHWIRLYMQYILPLIVVIIYLKGYYDMFSGKSTAVFVSWMCFAVLLLFVIFGISIFTGRKKTERTK